MASGVCILPFATSINKILKYKVLGRIDPYVLVSLNSQAFKIMKLPILENPERSTGNIRSYIFLTR